MGVGEKVIVFAKSENEARHMAVSVFRESPLREFLVYSDSYVYEIVNRDSSHSCFGFWMPTQLDNKKFKIRVFAKDKEEAKHICATIPLVFKQTGGDKP